VIDADVTRQARALGSFALMLQAAASRAHPETGIPAARVFIASAGRAQQAPDFFPMAEVLRAAKQPRSKTA